MCGHVGVGLSRERLLELALQLQQLSEGRENGLNGYTWSCGQWMDKTAGRADGPQGNTLQLTVHQAALPRSTENLKPSPNATHLAPTKPTTPPRLPCGEHTQNHGTWGTSSMRLCTISPGVYKAHHHAAAAVDQHAAHDVGGAHHLGPRLEQDEVPHLRGRTARTQH